MLPVYIYQNINVYNILISEVKGGNMRTLILSVSVVLSLLATAPAQAANNICAADARIAPANTDITLNNGIPVTVKLNGTPSLPGNATSYSWVQTGGPTVTLSSSTDSQPTFTTPDVGASGAALTFRLTVTGCDPSQSSSATTTVNIKNSAANQAPVAAATVTPASIYEGTFVTLDGTTSTDPDGNTLTYSWTQVSGPAVTFISNSGGIATFNAPTDVPYPGGVSLTFRLAVSDGFLTVSTDKIVNVQWVNDPPVARLSCPSTVNEREELTLNGLASSDSDDGIASYVWTQLLGVPNAVLPEYDPATASSIKFTAPTLTSSDDSMTFKLVVTDSHALSDSAECTVKVLDVTKPEISALPADILAEATAASGAAVIFSSPVAVDNVDGALNVTCIPASGATFAIGTTIVTCSAADKAGNKASAGFTVTVRDTTPPAVTAPSAVTKEATGPTTPVTFGTAAATDAVGVVSLTNDAPAAFPVGITIITWTARDAAGNTGTATQSITVTDTTAPTFNNLRTTSTLATSVSGAAVTFAPTATDLVDGNVGVTCTPASGSTFAIGTTIVTCSATDAHSNTAKADFNVTVNYGFNGLLSPYDSGKTYKIKSAIPIKWQYTSSTGAVLPSSTAKPAVMVYLVSSGPFKVQLSK